MKEAIQILLPKKSRDAFGKEYDKMLNWIAESCTEHINEYYFLSKYSMIKKTNKNIAN